MSITLVAGSSLLVLSSYADTAWKFVAAWGCRWGDRLGRPVLQRHDGRHGPYRPVCRAPKAYTWLTVIGGLASPIAFPLAGIFVEAWGLAGRDPGNGGLHGIVHIARIAGLCAATGL